MKRIEVSINKEKLTKFVSLFKYIASKLKALQTVESAAVQTQSGAKQCNAVQSGTCAVCSAVCSAVCPGQSAFCVSCITVASLKRVERRLERPKGERGGSLTELGNLLPWSGQSFDKSRQHQEP